MNYFINRFSEEIQQGNSGKKTQIFFIFSLLLLVFSIPYHRVSSSIPSIILLFSLVFLLANESSFRDKIFYKKILLNPYFILNILLILVYIFIHFIHPFGSKLGINLLVLIPLYFVSFFIYFKLAPQNISLLIKTYLWGLGLFSIFILIIATTNYSLLGYKSFLYIDLLKPIKANPITHSMFYNLGIALVGFQFKQAKTSKSKWIYTILLLFFVLMVGLCAAKIGYIILIISTLGALNMMIRSMLIKFLFFILFLGILYFSYQKIPFLNQKIDGFIWQLKNGEKLSMDDQLPRSIIWPLATDIISENKVLGLGVGNTRAALVSAYTKIDYKKGIENEFNAHNQFLETSLEVGIFGFILLALQLLFCIYLAVKHQSFLYFLIILIFIAYLLIESLLGSQMGLVSYGVFHAIFIAYLTLNRTVKSSLTDAAKLLNL
jgi:O-antigen ligase